MIPEFSLLKRYYEPQRAYHTLSHIYWMLLHFDPLRHLCETPEDVEAAIWFHDAVYDPRAKDNEERSVEVAQKLLGSRMTTEIERLILLTKHNAAPGRLDINGRVIIDCDLAIFGADWSLVIDYERGIRKEYRNVPIEVYKPARISILQSFLERESIYHTDLFIAKHEFAARTNINKLVRLVASGEYDGKV